MFFLLRQDEDESEEEDEKVEEKITRNWSVLKTTPQLHNSKVPTDV